MVKNTSSPLKMKTTDAYPEHEYNIIQLKNTSVLMFFSTFIHPVLWNVILELWMRFLSTALLRIHTVAHLSSYCRYTAAAGGGVPCSRVLDESLEEENKALIPFPQ